MPSQLNDTLRFAFKALQVRLRFALLLLVAFVVVGQWDRLRTAWNTMTTAAWGHRTDHGAVSSDVEFFCPMDPGVINDWPSICPVCNMVLVRRKKGQMTALPEGVVARMQFSPYRVQLAGIQTSPIAPKKVVLELSASSELAAATTENRDRLSLKVDLPRRASLFDLTSRTAFVTTADLPGVEPCEAKVASQSGTTVVLDVDNQFHWLQPGMWAQARFEIPLREIEPFRSAPGSSEKFLTVPETAVVDFGTQQVVYVETHPGTFDGRSVTLGPICGDEYPVIAGLVAGQRVATTGAFLIDAEARLNPSAAASYFGAAGATTPVTPTAPAASSEAVTPPPKTTQTATPKLSKADLALVKRQKICPITELPLDSMGGPVPVIVQGRKVFICCEGCEGKLKSEPQKYLAKLPKK